MLNAVLGANSSGDTYYLPDGRTARRAVAETWLPIAATDVRDLPPLRRQITNAFEVGYKGALPGGTTFTADVHGTRVHRRFLGNAIGSSAHSSRAAGNRSDTGGVLEPGDTQSGRVSPGCQRESGQRDLG